MSAMPVFKSDQDEVDVISVAKKRVVYAAPACFESARSWR